MEKLDSSNQCSIINGNESISEQETIDHQFEMIKFQNLALSLINSLTIEQNEIIRKALKFQ